ncbi:MAG TPA: DUF4835 family protein [Candidatus Marinimicrobia bacterium]|nr:DUF4835 family protein [Candidatus Neomarinimicrobiota bacterium]
MQGRIEMSGARKLTLVILIILPFYLFPQFVDVKVEIITDRLPEKERTELKVLEQQLPGYFENYEWFENKFDIQVPLRIKIFPQSVNNSGYQRVFSGQFFIYNESGDTRFLEKSFSFVYNTNQPLVHSPTIDPLTSPFDFYAYLFIACEMDTYEPFGGNPLFEKARDIASRALISEWPRGWKERLKRLDEIVALRDYRMFKYHFWHIMDLVNQEKHKQISEAISKALESLEKIFEVNSRERYTHVFLDAHARDFIEILKEYGSDEQIQKLIQLDPDNKELYESALRDKE